MFERKIRRVALPKATRAGSSAIVSIGLLDLTSAYPKCHPVRIGGIVDYGVLHRESQPLYTADYGAVRGELGSVHWLCVGLWR